MAPRGFADVHYERIRGSAGTPTDTRVEVTPRDPAQLNPRQFQMITSEVRGRVLIGARDGPPEGDTVRTRLMPLVGTWGPNVPVAFTARFPEGTVNVFGAGIDPSSKSLLGSLRQAMSSPGARPLDMGGLQAKGALDFRGEIQVATGDAPNRSNYWFFLRDSALETSDGFALDALRGVLTVKDEQLYGERLQALISNTPVSCATRASDPDRTATGSRRASTRAVCRSTASTWARSSARRRSTRCSTSCIGLARSTCTTATSSPAVRRKGRVGWSSTDRSLRTTCSSNSACRSS